MTREERIRRWENEAHLRQRKAADLRAQADILHAEAMTLLDCASALKSDLNGEAIQQKDNGDE